MAVRDDFAAGEVLAAADLNDTFASKLPYSYGTATPSTTDSGFLWYDSNSTPAAPKFWDGAAFQALTSGKILQVVRATDSTDRSTTSTSFVDVTGMSVTITPQLATSSIWVYAYFNGVISRTSAFGTDGEFQITDSSNNALVGAEQSRFGNYDQQGTTTREIKGAFALLGYSTPATTSATTYKLRFSAVNSSSTLSVLNASRSTGVMVAMEVSA